LEDMDFRYDAINNLMEKIKKFDHYSFLSATPIDINYEIDFFKNLPHYKVIWNNCFKVNTIRYKTPYAAKALARFIQIFMKEGITIKDINNDFTDVDQLYIFINSVKSIKQVLDTLKLNPDKVKICCADRNRNRLILDEYKIESVCNPNKKINFFTKKCFQGCNLFTNNGLIIVVSDGRLDHTLVDISTSMEQIVGRIRTNSEYQNVFRHLLVHIFSTNNNILSDNEFDSLMKDKEVEANNLLSVQNKVTNDELTAIISRLDIENDILSIINGKLIYNELKRQSFIYKQELKKAYKNGISIRAKFSKSEKFVVHSQEEWTDLDIKLSKAVTISYQQLLKDYLDHPDNSYELEYPEFSLIKEYLTESEMNSLRWNKDKMMKAVNDKKIMDKIYMNIFKTGFISNKDLKAKFKLEFEKYNITLSPKASLIEDCRLYDVRKCQKRIDETKVSGYELSNLYIKL